MEKHWLPLGRAQQPGGQGGKDLTLMTILYVLDTGGQVPSQPGVPDQHSCFPQEVSARGE